MDTNTEPKKHVRRTNAEILADMKAEKAAPKKRIRRTNAQIERDRRKAEDEKLKQELANVQTVKVVEFLSDTFVFGRDWAPGDVLKLTKGTIYYDLAFDRDGKFILNKTVEQQKKLWGKIKYVVREEAINGTYTT